MLSRQDAASAVALNLGKTSCFLSRIVQGLEKTPGTLKRNADYISFSALKFTKTATFEEKSQ